MIKCIDIPQEICTDLERKMYEFNIARDNIAFLINMNREDVSILKSAVFTEYLKEEITKSKIYEEAKADLITKFVPETLGQAAWKVNFKTNQLELTLDENE